MVLRPKDFKPVGLKWAFKVKRNLQGEVLNYKAWSEEKGYDQRYGYDFDEVFVHMARLGTIQA